MMMSFRFTLIACLSLLLSPTVFAKNNPQMLDGIAAIVNDSAITQSEVNRAENTIKAEMMSTNTPIPPANVLQKKVLDQVIDRKLQLQAAEQAGIKISDKQVDDTINTIAKQNGVTADVLYTKVAMQNLSRAEYRKEIREELTLQQVQQQQVGSKVIMNPDEVKSFMRSKAWQTALNTEAPIKEYHVEDLVVLLPDAATPENIANAKIQADMLLTQAKQGVNYNNLIKPNDKTMETNDLGWRKLNDIPSAFAEQIAAAKKGSVVGPIQTGNGFHLVRLVDVRDEKSVAKNAMPAPTEKEAEQMLYQRKFAEVLKKWIARLHSQAVINMHPESMG